MRAPEGSLKNLLKFFETISVEFVLNFAYFTCVKFSKKMNQLQMEALNGY